MKYLFAFVLVLSTGLMALDEKAEMQVKTQDGYCNVTTYGEYTASSGRCFYGDVMTGLTNTNPAQVRCSRLNINCNRTDKE